ncbi:winged helix-turn-helix domain-containing protein [Methanonatronarchaeum sp. AMET-Sl]|uniref:winged helix-turn-helix domain-containing protein n=1 Tax=Methanonatronarchaeum sp. AMET-Sl TaxID=3037654 RepID=UPI00244DF6FF|nr:winged helix-turn-helix domain-containing protein [Methanonatronarchaeum sp. AMET-Sl]WGI17242.1 winged helix-turn-helix domain-containing protein [Methanonatronarchaeum sp. AMET-Sl]
MEKNKETILRALNYNDLTFLELEKRTNLNEETLEKTLDNLDKENLIEKVREGKGNEFNQFKITEKGKRVYQKYMRNHFDTAEE